MTSARTPSAILIVTTVLLLGAAAPASAQEPATSCLQCHGDADQFDEEMVNLVRGFAADVHGEVGLSCHDCHGGNPDPALHEDMEAAMDPGFAANPYRGVPERGSIPGFCGRCHSDPTFMKRFKPDPRVDQEVEYGTSNHGKSLARGDTKVATCIDCHGVHGILRAANPESQVFPKNVARTCGHCHSDPTHMAGYKTAVGRTLPVDQVVRWERSVHAAALFEKDDLSAPTCNDCHGNHGAAPPGVESVAYVCGQCHGREATLFRGSEKLAGFQDHNVLIADDEATSCSDCHESPEPQAAMTRVHSFSECATCHENHAVVRPTVALLGPLPDTPCAFCHEVPGVLGEDAEPEAIQRHYAEIRSQLLEEAQSRGLDGNDRFDWLVDQALGLTFHTNPSEGGESAARLRPEFQRLFDKFRIGKTQYSYQDPAGGGEVTVAVTRCNDCHSEDDSAGGAAASFFLEGMRELTTRTAQAERVLLAAQRGGVETENALADVDQAINAQIELEVLVHTFSSDETGPFAVKRAEGVEHARAAIVAGTAALDEIANRRKGLVVSLVFITLVLVGLGLKIRQVAFRAADGK